MKLLFFIHSLSSGGAERVTTNLANYWASKGWHITVVTLDEIASDFYHLLPGVQRIALGMTHDSRTTLRGLANNCRRILALRRILKKVQPDIALSMMSTANVLLALAAWHLSDLAVIGSERIHPPQFPLGPVWERLRALCYGRLGAITALSKAGALWLNENTNARNTIVVPNAVNWPIGDHPPRIEPQGLVPSQKHLMLAVGRLDPQKGFDLLIDAFAELSSSQPDWMLVILGEGEERARLEQKIKHYQMQDCILLPGRVGNVGQWYEVAQLYVLSSRFEGFPNTLVEAMAYGVAAISFDCDSGPRDIIRHGVDGLLVQPGDCNALRSALARMMTDDALRLRFGERAIAVRDRFSMEKIASIWENLFRELKDGFAPT